MIHKALKQPLLDGCVKRHVLRMPLDGKAEGIIFYLQCLREAFRAVGGNPQPLSYRICGLMMKAVYRDSVCHEKLAYKAVGIQLNGMSGISPVQKIRMGIFLLRLNILK